MHSIIAAALIVTTAFATPLLLHPESDATNLTIHTRQDSNSKNPGDGEDSGIAVTLYAKPGCKGDAALSNQEMFYDAQYARQMQSYSLNNDIGDDDVLTVWADIDWSPTGSKGINPKLDGDTSAACAQYVYNLEGDHTKQGCHSLTNVVGCMTIMINQSPNNN